MDPQRKLRDQIGLQFLPVELLIEIIKQNPDVLSLANLVIALPWIRGLLLRREWEDLIVKVATESQNLGDRVHRQRRYVSSLS